MSSSSRHSQSSISSHRSSQRSTTTSPHRFQRTTSPSTQPRFNLTTYTRRWCSTPAHQITFFPRDRRPLNPQFPCQTRPRFRRFNDPLPPLPPAPRTHGWEFMLPECVRQQAVNLVKSVGERWNADGRKVNEDEGKGDEEEYLMTGGMERKRWFVEGREEQEGERIWGVEGEWDGVEGRRVELGLS